MKSLILLALLSSLTAFAETPITCSMTRNETGTTYSATTKTYENGYNYAYANGVFEDENLGNITLSMMVQYNTETAGSLEFVIIDDEGNDLGRKACGFNEMAMSTEICTEALYSRSTDKDLYTVRCYFGSTPAKF